jgi:hypothetical protein
VRGGFLPGGSGTALRGRGGRLLVVIQLVNQLTSHLAESG